MKKIKINEIDINFIKRKEQKNIRLFLDKNGEVSLSMPFFCSEKKAIDFASKNIDWIKKHSHACEKQIFKPNLIINILGNEYQIIHDISQKTGIKIHENLLIVGGEESFIHRRISNYIKKELLKYIIQKTNEFSSIIQKKPNKITLKDTTSRWGSCSSKQNLNFCWKIGLAPLFVIDYLIAHEMSHLKEMNHQEKFWKTVSLLNVQQAQAEIWLRKNGKRLMHIK
jgi:predicted metal-dependent hydrolase